jgi:hypothetical protein
MVPPIKRTKFRRLANHYASTFTSSEPMIYACKSIVTSKSDMYGSGDLSEPLRCIRLSFVLGGSLYTDPNENFI